MSDKTPTLSELVHTTVQTCLAEDAAESDLVVQAVVHTFAFVRAKVDAQRRLIAVLLDRMPPQFHIDSGDGWSFLNLCVDRNGEHWGEHPSCEALVALGLATGMAKFLLPRDMWNLLPGGVPYVCFDTSTPTSESSPL